MATYTSKQFPYSTPKRRKQKYSLLQETFDFRNAPITSGRFGEAGAASTAWASGDILQAIHIRAGQTVLGVQVELVDKGTADGRVTIGYGSETERWGRVSLDGTVGVQFNDPDFYRPLYFSSADTIDLIISGATVTSGRIRIIVHLLEDDR